MTYDQHEEEPTGPPINRPSRGPAGAPSTAAEWRDLLRKDELPDEFADLPRRQRRRAAKRWRSARRMEREQAIRHARSKPPTTLAVPALALVVAAAIAVGTLLWPGDDGPARTSKPKAGPAAPISTPSTTPSTPAAHPTVELTDPDKVAREFVNAYTTRLPYQDGSHAAAVKRAAPYASTPLVENLKRHGDKDFDHLVAAQALEAKPTKVEIAQPTEKQRPAPDTSVRVYRQATVTIAVKGTDPYTYTRHLTLEVSRADPSAPWMVTRVLGIEE
ncbi:hypothetical protein ABR737_01400 [Streptomyces sp. Edi2]|uniref:hypothetical protein n=1 Tax=Streptomyces sp. Edi2 TaxID=3162528 RepID=UPI003305CFC3